MSLRLLALVTAVALLVVYLTTGHATVVATGDAPDGTAASGEAASPAPTATTAGATPAEAETATAASPAPSAATTAPPLATPAPAPATSKPAAPARVPTTPGPTPASTPVAPSAPAKPTATTAAPTPVPMVAPAPSAPVVAAPTVLEVGVVHPWVVLSQRRLNTLGYGPVEADGRFGPATQAAVVRFEQGNTTTVDGRLEVSERLLLLSSDAQAYVDPAPPLLVAAPAAPALPPVKLPLPGGPLATAATARANVNCQAIEAEFLSQGAEPEVADTFAYVIAPRESGCWPQMVNSATDLSYSRLGLNFIGSMPTYWGNLCGVTDYRATAELSVDVRCGLAAYRALGWKPWSM